MTSRTPKDAMYAILKEYRLMYWHGTVNTLTGVLQMIDTHKTSVNMETLRVAIKLDLKAAKKHLTELSAPQTDTKQEERKNLCN